MGFGLTTPTLPLLSAVLLTGLLVVSSRLPLRSGARDAGERAGAGAGIPTRFWAFAAFAVLGRPRWPAV
jgi:hypothetical protein